MKRRISLILAALPLILTLAFVFGTGTAHAYDPNDPYDSGCSQSAYIANSGTLSLNGYTVHAENWYSTGCNKNWARIWWSGGSAVSTLVESYNDYGALECYPTNCSSYYSGGLSPSWTNMIDGTNVAYVDLYIRVGSSYNSVPYHWLAA